MGHFAKVCRSKTVNHSWEGDETGSSTEAWPEIDQIKSVNVVNRVDFFKATLLVEGEPKEFNINTGSRIIIIPQVIIPKDLKETAKCFVDVNRKKQGDIANTYYRIQKHTTIVGTKNVRQTGNWAARKQKYEHQPTFKC